MKTAWTWSPQARGQLRGIDPENAMRILRALTKLAETGAGNVKLIFYTMLAEVVHSRQVAILKTA